MSRRMGKASECEASPSGRESDAISNASVNSGAGNDDIARQVCEACDTILRERRRNVETERFANIRRRGSNAEESFASRPWPMMIHEVI